MKTREETADVCAKC